ncbi:MAG: hypothetical protein NT061_01130 [Spirochaetes bacterium]|nr:hypothetical protein [Spirochaetota bacterium]
MPENKEIHIYCDGKELPLVPFVATLFRSTLQAMTGCLKGFQGGKSITISFEADKVKEE